MTDPFQKPDSADTVREAVPIDSPELGCAVQRHLKARINPKSRHSIESGQNRIATTNQHAMWTDHRHLISVMAPRSTRGKSQNKARVKNT